ncbi:MAG: DUF423 domain-containing protein [Cyanobacteria bacterium P01_G01_bin.19]
MGNKTVTRIFLAIAAVLGGTSVVLGAFASHALKDRLSERALEIWETGTKYQMYHAIALILVALLLGRLAVDSIPLIIAGYAFIAGTMLFSGSLYALSLTGIKILGAVTPLGGVGFITGWICLAIAALNLE